MIVVEQRISLWHETEGLKRSKPENTDAHFTSSRFSHQNVDIRQERAPVSHTGHCGQASNGSAELIDYGQ